MAAFVIPYRIGGSPGSATGARARDAADATDAVNELAAEALVVDGPGGSGRRRLWRVRGPVTIVNSDLRAPRAQIEELTAAAPPSSSQRTGRRTLALRDVARLRAAHGPGSAARFQEHLAAVQLDLPGLRDDVDTWDDLERVRDRVGKNTRGYLEALARA